jgi:DNA invertase Pin-like site-specific DNA recombinase
MIKGRIERIGHYAMKRAAIYLRVSTREQSTAPQRAELEGVAARAGWDVVEVYEDAGISGAKGRDQRPAFDRLLKDATLRRFDVVMVWSIDRLGRSLQHLVVTLADLQAARIDLYLRQQAVDTTTPSGRALFQMLGVFAEFERGIIRERVQAGVDRARAAGKRLGRPKTDAKLAAKIRVSLRAGSSIRKTADRHRVGISTVQRIKAAAVTGIS